VYTLTPFGPTVATLSPPAIVSVAWGGERPLVPGADVDDRAGEAEQMVAEPLRAHVALALAQRAQRRV
jgi:hypothetical protein